MEEESSGPPRKKSKSERCVICNKLLSEEKAVLHPTEQGISTLLDAAEIRQDAIHERISKSRNGIMDGTVKIAFHKSCRASYTAKHNLQLASRKKQSNPSTSTTEKENIDPLRRCLRAYTPEFCIRTQCFICGSSYKRHEKLTPISTGTGNSTREHVLKAAKQRSDEKIELRMMLYQDLLAYDAKYHRSCYASYISKRNIQAAESTVKREIERNPTKKGFELLCKEIENTMLSGEKKILLLTEMNARFVDILHSVGVNDADSYRSWKLKEKLKSHFGDRIIFISRAGKSDLVCSKELSLGDVITRLNNLNLKSAEEGTDFEFSSNDDNDESDLLTLHKAAGIIRKNIANVSFCSDFYPTTGDLCLEKCVEFVPPILVDFISWCTSEEAFGNATCSTDVCPSVKTLAVCHSIIGLSCNIATPISFGLGIQLHHKFGSRHLIETLHALGYSIPYDEVRRFMTSAAEEDEDYDGTYIPRGIARYKEDDLNSIIDAAIDNFDQNEETLDGLSTTHSMATVLYQRTASSGNTNKIPRSQRKSLQPCRYIDEPLSIFNKPHIRPEPRRVTEGCIFTTDLQYMSSCKQAKKGDLVWKLCRKKDNTSLPAWSGFNTMVSQTNVAVAHVRYLPFINAPPSNFSTVYTAILRLICIAKSQAQPHILVTADLAIYSKAQQIIWSKPELQESVTMRLGGMHLIMSFIGSIGKLFGDGGLLDILTSSNVYATGTARMLLQGKHFAKGMRGVKIAHEALTHLYLSAAESYANENDLPWINDEFHILSKKLQKGMQSYDHNSCSEVYNLLKSKISDVIQTLSMFSSFGQEQSHTFKYWLSFLEAGDLLLRLIRADKEADFILHLQTAMDIISYFHMAGRINYARYTPVYVSEMRQLEFKQPVMYKFLENGGFVVRRTKTRDFNCVPTDQALEQTINREAKGTGGVIGFTLRKSALLRWMLTRHISGEYSEGFQQLFENTSQRNTHEELSPSRMLRDKSDVTAIKDYILNHCQNPFDVNTSPKELVNITTGQIATKDVQEYLTSIPEKGKAVVQSFISERLIEGGTASFWSSIPKSKVVTFENMKKVMSFDTNKKLTLDPEVLFRRLLSVAKYRDIDMKKVLSYELTPVPSALFHPDGTMRKCTKSDLAQKLEENAMQETELKNKSPTPTAYIIDGMSFIQGVNESQFRTFDDLGEVIFKKLINLFMNSELDIKTMVLVYDRYDLESGIKGQERQRRGDWQTTPDYPSHIITGNREVPNFRKFLKSGKNKMVLIHFLTNHVEAKAIERLPENKVLIIAGGYPNGEAVREITHKGSRYMEDLFSTHEEADTRMILHAIHVSSFPRTVIRCDDTDVLVLLLYYRNRGELSNDVYMHTGHAGKFVSRERFIPVTKIAEALGKGICSVLPAAHANTGCDTTSGIFKLGKRTAYTIFLKHQETLIPLTEFHSLDVDASLEAARKLVLLMYGKGMKRKACETLNELRFQMATLTDKPVSSLPPTDDAFMQHVLRAKLQTIIWCTSHIAKPKPLDPTNYGWQKSGRDLQCVTSLKESAPKELRDLTHLFCKDVKCTDGRKCPCKIAGLRCIEICSCESCSNTDIVYIDDGDDDN